MNLISIIFYSVMIITAIINVAVLLAIKFNDLKHFTQDLKEIKEKQETQGGKLESLSERVARIEGKINGK